MDIYSVIHRHIISSRRPAQITLPSVDACIYCYRTADAGIRLEREHILADGFGGDLILPNASCRDCAKIIHKFETETLKKYCGLSRAKIIMKSRKRRKKEECRDYYNVFDTEWLDLNDTSWEFTTPSPRSIVSLPSAYTSEHFYGRAGLLSDIPIRRDFSVTQNIIDDSSTTKSYFGLSFSVTLGSYLRTIMKTAHAYAVSCVGLDNFKPFLYKYIIEGAREDLDQYIGTVYFPKESYYHELSLDYLAPTKGPRLYAMQERNLNLVVVTYIRLWANYDAPVHEVVVGSLKSAASIARPSPRTQ